MIIFRVLWNYRGFILGSVKREFQVKYQNSLLGAAWNVINPERPLELARALAEASRSSELRDMALRARVAAEAKYQFESVRAAYKRVVKELCAD